MSDPDCHFTPDSEDVLESIRERWDRGEGIELDMKVVQNTPDGPITVYGRILIKDGVIKEIRRLDPLP